MAIARSESSTAEQFMDDATNRPAKAARLRRLGIHAAVVCAAFLLGFVPMWLTARARAHERDAVQQALRLVDLENTLAAAAVQVRRGDYEPARTAASAFYTNLQDELDRSPSVVSTSQREAMQSLLGQRDQVITLLARADPAVAERLSDLYVSYRRTMGTLPQPAQKPVQP